VVEFLAGASSDVADLAPGAKLDELVDLLVLANEAAAEELRTTMRPSATAARAEQQPEIDLLLGAPTPRFRCSQVFLGFRQRGRQVSSCRKPIPPRRISGKSVGPAPFR